MAGEDGVTWVLCLGCLLPELKVHILAWLLSSWQKSIVADICVAGCEKGLLHSDRYATSEWERMCVGLTGMRSVHGPYQIILTLRELRQTLIAAAQKRLRGWRDNPSHDRGRRRPRG